MSLDPGRAAALAVLECLLLDSAEAGVPATSCAEAIASLVASATASRKRGSKNP